MYKKIRIVLSFLVVFSLCLTFVTVPSTHAVIAVDDAFIISGLTTAILVAAGATFTSQNTSGQTLGNYFASKVNSYVGSLGSTISETFNGTVDYNSDGIQLDNSFQTAINNFINWWVDDSNLSSGTSTQIIDDLYINGQNVTNQPVSSSFPGCYFILNSSGTGFSIKGFNPWGNVLSLGNLSTAYPISNVNLTWSLNKYNSEYYYSVYVTYDSTEANNVVHRVYNTSFNYSAVRFSVSNSNNESTTTTIPEDLEETIVTFVPPSSGNNGSSGKNNIDLTDVGFAIAGGAYTVETLRDEINALYNRVVTDTPTEIVITIIPEQFQPSPSPQVSPSPTPVIPYIPSGFEDWYQSLHDDIGDLTEQTEDIKEQLEGTPDTSVNYQVDLTTVFPFSIPFDIHRLVQAFNADPVAPHIVIPFNVPSINLNYTFDLDFSQFNSLAIILRNLEFVAFCVGLAILTGKVIKW